MTAHAYRHALATARRFRRVCHLYECAGDPVRAEINRKDAEAIERKIRRAEKQANRYSEEANR